MLEILSSTIIKTMPVFDNPYTFNFIGRFIQLLMESLPSMWLGIVVFTVILKVITLPLDIYSRVSMKKNSLKMERMRPQLEKLQRQYANNKEMYNMKMQALYKKEGYSMFSTCLPTIVTLIVFIIVINQFSNYSNYENLELIQSMVRGYNNAVETYNETEKVDFVKQVGNEFYIDETKILSDDALTNAGITRTAEGKYTVSVSDNAAVGKFFNYVKKLNDNGYKGVTAGVEVYLDADGVTYKFSKENYAQDAEEQAIADAVVSKVISDQCEPYLLKVKEKARKAAADAYYANVPDFLWVKNIWAEDLFWKHPVKNTFSEYKFTIRQGCKAVDAGLNMEDTSYEELTYNLSAEKSAPNGYCILAILSIGVMLLSTLITNKSQKAQMELQTVDGQAAQTSKMMTWMMPVMFGIFAFIYTASFSIYMVVSSVISIGFTLLINTLVEKRFNKKIEEEQLQNDKRYRKNKQ